MTRANGQLRKDAGRTRAILLLVTARASDADAAELEMATLARTAGIDLCGIVRARPTPPHAKYFVGSGKAEEAREALELQDADALLVNLDVSPRQEGNLERVCRRPVVGYTRLILDIFSNHARSHEGKLQVALAQMQYMATRLVRGWSHLERQRGGIGLRGGPGEQQLETDRRLLRRRIERTQAQLDKIRRSRDLSLRRRRKRDLFSVALVGYTNTGKSTLFHQLTGADVYRADEPFATLDPTIRRMKGGREGIVVSDTVGFIANLPHTLVDAFAATLTEVRSADLLVHVIDLSQTDLPRRNREVASVLRELKADKIQCVTVLNKADLAGMPAGVLRATDGRILRITMSAANGDGVPLLESAIREYAAAAHAAGRTPSHGAHVHARDASYSSPARR